MVSASRVNFTTRKTSGTFCRPDYTQGTAKEKNSASFETALEALAAGFRPCKNCKPLKTGLADPAWIEALMAKVDANPAKRWHDHDLVGMNLDPAAVRRWFIANALPSIR